MGATLDGKLVVAISSRALFDFEEENRLFDTGDDRAYMRLQLERLEQPAAPAGWVTQSDLADLSSEAEPVSARQRSSNA